MIPSIPQSRLLRTVYAGYVGVFFLYLAAPLTMVALFAFNDSPFPSLPWEGFTLDWFVASSGERIGLFFDDAIHDSLWVSIVVAFWVSVGSVLVGTCNAFLFERYEFRFKGFLYLLMLTPLVIPGVILGIALLVFTNGLANQLYDGFGLDLDILRPGLALVILGQFSFIATIATLVISARLRKFDRSLEEAALNLGATHMGAVRTVTLPYLKPALFGAGMIAFLMSFENFNTTLMLVGSDSPLTITMFGRLRDGSTPVLNAVSLMLMVVSAVLAGASLLPGRGTRAT